MYESVQTLLTPWKTVQISLKLLKNIFVLEQFMMLKKVHEFYIWNQTEIFIETFNKIYGKIRSN